MESDKLKTGDLVLRYQLTYGMPGVQEISLVVWANNYIFNVRDRHGQIMCFSQTLAEKGWQLLQRIDMYGAQDEV